MGALPSCLKVEKPCKNVTIKSKCCDNETCICCLRLKKDKIKMKGSNIIRSASDSDVIR